MSFFEALMLLCFGLSWPISIAKALRTKKVVGKSPLFMAVICLGYVSGILHKVFYAFDWVVVLYVINLLMVATDLFLYYHYLSEVPSTT
jgi:predicted tellurium resistance membrane protein TerC